MTAFDECPRVPFDVVLSLRLYPDLCKVYEVQKEKQQELVDLDNSARRRWNTRARQSPPPKRVTGNPLAEALGAFTAMRAEEKRTAQEEKAKPKPSTKGKEPEAAHTQARDPFSIMQKMFAQGAVSEPAGEGPSSGGGGAADRGTGRGTFQGTGRGTDRNGSASTGIDGGTGRGAGRSAGQRGGQRGGLPFPKRADFPMLWSRWQNWGDTQKVIRDGVEYPVLDPKLYGGDHNHNLG